MNTFFWKKCFSNSITATARHFIIINEPYLEKKKIEKKFLIDKDFFTSIKENITNTKH